MNNKGYLPLQFLLVMGYIAAVTTLGLVKTGLDGTLANNAKVIACKAANKGEAFCNEKYNYTPKKDKVVKKGGGLRTRILATQK